MGNIVLLDDLTINKIAAGEVIERPASVIKEMVENSIDAGATNITVEIKNGGISFIKITDNGKGIPEDDLEIAFERHATSKIRSADDLDTVTSMGFRGEALASIAAIANVEMVSKTANQDTGFKIVVEGGNVLNKEIAGCPVGTSITVRNLFFNTPVRYKFLKKDYTESGYIEDVITRIALIHPEIAIKLINTGKTIIQTNGNGDLKTVIYSIYGKDIANGVIEANYEYEDIKVSGVIGKPEIARSNRSNQIFFVNKRYIKDKSLSSAAEQAYKGMIPIGKFSFLILNIEMNPSQVDVNVHPAKLEVRFEEENKVFKAIYHTIKDTLLKSELVADTDHTSSEKREASGLFGQNVVTNEEIKYEIPAEQEIQINEEEKPQALRQVEAKEINYEEQNIQNDKIENEKTIKVEIPEQVQEIKEKMQELENNEKEVADEKSFEEMYLKMFGKMPVKQNEQVEENEEEQIGDIAKLENISVFENIEEYQKPNYKFIGIVFNTYIIIEIEKEMYILDQHAAHERILYEKVKKNYYSDEHKDSQLLLLPDIITLSHKEMEIAKENKAMFEKAGFTLEEFGDNTIKLTGVPEMCIDLETRELFLETLDEINTVARTAKQEKEERFIATVACKAAVKANMALTKEEVDKLMTELLKLPNPFTCPHGRPTAIKMSKYDIERKFARK